jgi:hypothetical protein
MTFLLFLRVHTKELILWTIHGNAASDEKPDSIWENQNRFRSGGIGK